MAMPCAAPTPAPASETVPENIRALISAGALFVANHSGGKDSQAMLIRLARIVPKKQLLVVHASLGDVEWEGALELARDHAASIGCTFRIATARKTFFEMVEHRFTVRPGPDSSCWPSSSNRQCTSDLKRDPIQREVRAYASEHGFKTVVTCLGIRAEESPGRSKRAAFSVNKRGTNTRREWFEWLPIHALTTHEVFATIRDAGATPHPAYAAGNQRLSCVFCIMSSPRDLANGARHRPELLQRYIEIERRTGYTMHQSRKPLAELVALGETRMAQAAAACGACP